MGTHPRTSVANRPARAVRVLPPDNLCRWAPGPQHVGTAPIRHQSGGLFLCCTEHLNAPNGPANRRDFTVLGERGNGKGRAA